MTATLSDMTVPSWASHIEDKLAPMPLLLVQAYVDTVDQDLGTDILAHADQARAWLAEAGLTPQWHRFIPEGDSGHSLILARSV